MIVASRFSMKYAPAMSTASARENPGSDVPAVVPVPETDPRSVTRPPCPWLYRQATETCPASMLILATGSTLSCGGCPLDSSRIMKSVQALFWWE